MTTKCIDYSKVNILSSGITLFNNVKRYWLIIKFKERDSNNIDYLNMSFKNINLRDKMIKKINKKE